MKVWVVGVSDCEGNSIGCICATKEIAERELFKARDEWVDDMYKNMITALSGDDYEKWNNYPHDRPYLYETEILEL